MTSGSYNYSLEFITPEEDSRRGVVFLISEDKKVTAKINFDRLKKNTENMFRARFDYWLSGMPYPRGYHGWDKTEYQGKYINCFVFTCREGRKAQRLYGFLSRPKPYDRGYQACVLIRYAEKTKHETDEVDLKIVEEMRLSLPIQKIVLGFFKEKS